MADWAGFRETAGRRVGGFGRVALGDADGVRRAAVVLCVAERDGELGVLVIKRANRGRNPGQWALPGGRAEDGETLQETGLRELREELGLEIAEADVLGMLDDFPAASGFAITPVVAVAQGAGEPVPDAREVRSVHHVPLRVLAADGAVNWVDRPDGGRLLQMRLGPGMTIHAPTGAMLWQFREVVLLGRDVRVADLIQPDWTRN
ncbi:ADP-ribose pyrophosphatase YjhB (NUDIX family) [Actinocorallia herbida]|uniref:ADP-ribose pyrophosphatase YjhB (NUDIX family) n=1 Tax=Actinocorallia herbida TaxID=58109 RepID=A0A3N1CW45_9ACTN|nr:CoA pyrophosphatase [Actinocorallia herbida]ROO85510.1 ADP-ribose pyrophosphatase YjhB (NUDIX family) [Actinocorallia herbida]